MRKRGPQDAGTPLFGPYELLGIDPSKQAREGDRLADVL
jgi:hypothetical protein